MKCPICSKDIEDIIAEECDICGHAICTDCVTRRDDGAKVCTNCQKQQ
ncbi:MAG: hypothetical protein AABZ39_13580 [Spirochaetota bacterium]